MKTEINDRITSINRGEAPNGYRVYEENILPDEWSIVKLEEIIEKLESGVSINSVDRQCKESEFGILKTSCANNGRFYPEENKVIVEEEIELAKLNPRKGMLIISRMNTPGLVGEVGYVDEDYNHLFIPDRLWQTCFSEEIDSKWLVSLMTTFNIRKKIKNIATGTSNSMKNISKSEFLSIEIPKPPLQEQQKIASILSTWDKAIELKEQLIEEKKQQKKGLMKKLLTGEFRLPGFDSEWKEVKIGTILKERCETKHNSLELLAITGKNGIVKRTEVDIKDNSNEDKSKYKRICPLDIGYNTMRMWQGVSGVSEYEGIVSPAYTILAPTENIDSYFIGYLFKFPKMINIFWRHSQGMVNDTLNLKYSNLKNIKVKIPKEKSEQSEIAKMLMTIDKNIELIEVELSAIRIQKKGLMQLLLTGIIRVNL